MSALPERLVLFDGRCGLCDRTVQRLLELDREGCLSFAPLEGPTATSILSRHPEVPPDIDSILFVERSAFAEHVSWRSTAIVRIAAQLPSPPWPLRWLRFVPTPLADLGYRIVAALRHRLWGRLPACRVPSAEDRARFLP